jgi:pimeloyl-ACP methyl ester carboxylesterase
MPETALPDGRTLQWSEGGDPHGVPVFFHHGCPDTRRAAAHGYAAAAAAGVRLVAANRPGYGASTPAPPSYRRVADDVVALADRLGVERFGVLGMSVGGTFALATAAHHPDRVTAGALVATPGEAPAMDPPFTRDDLDPPARAWYAALAAGTLEDNLETVRPGFLDYRSGVAPDDPDDAALAERWLAPLPEADRRLLAGRSAGDLAADAREALGLPDGYLSDAALVFRAWEFDVADVRCPMTLWYGDRDPNAPPRNGRWLAGRLPAATLHVLPGLGHLESLLRSWPAVLRSAAARYPDG